MKKKREKRIVFSFFSFSESAETKIPCFSVYIDRYISTLDRGKQSNVTQILTETGTRRVGLASVTVQSPSGPNKPLSFIYLFI